MEGCHSMIKVLLLAKLWVSLKALAVGHFFSLEVLLIEVVSGGCEVPLFDPLMPGPWESGPQCGPDVVLGIPGTPPEG